MLRKFARGLMVVALIFSIRAAWAAGDENVAAEVRAGLKTLDSNGDRSAASRLALAKAAIGAASTKQAKDPAGAQECWDAAHEALTEASRLDPGNREVADTMALVQKHITVAPPATKPAVAPPATKPGPETKPAAPEPAVVKRMVTPVELNRIRQLEWKADENPAPKVQVLAETRKKYLAASPDVVPGDFNHKTQEAQAQEILASGKEELYPGVHILVDPASIREFKIAVEKVVVANCANCHSGNKIPKFNLYAEPNDSAVYSNFLILQRYSAFVNNAQRLMIDRTTPESSLLLQFMLPPDQSDAPHPAKGNFRAPVRAKSDTRYELVKKWLKSLDPLAPNYGIDLTADAPAPVVVPKK